MAVKPCSHAHSRTHKHTLLGTASPDSSSTQWSHPTAQRGGVRRLQHSTGSVSVTCAVCPGVPHTWGCQLQVLHLDIRRQHAIEVHHQAVRLDAVGAADHVEVCNCTCGVRASVRAAGACVRQGRGPAGCSRRLLACVWPKRSYAVRAPADWHPPTTRPAGSSTLAAAFSSSPCTVRTLGWNWNPAKSEPSYATTCVEVQCVRLPPCVRRRGGKESVAH